MACGNRYRKGRDEGTLHGWPRPNSELLKKWKRSPFFLEPKELWRFGCSQAGDPFYGLAPEPAFVGAIEKRPRNDLALVQFWQWPASRASCSYMPVGCCVCCAVVCCCGVCSVASMCTASCAVLVCARTRALCSTQLPTSAEWNQSINACHHICVHSPITEDEAARILLFHESTCSLLSSSCGYRNLC